MDILSLNKPPQDYTFVKPPQNPHSNNELDLSEENLTQVLNSLQEEAVQKISDSCFIEAISDLMHCEEILESVAAKGELTDIDEVIILLNNLAMCYQRIGEVDKALVYLEGALYNFKSFMSKPCLKNEIKVGTVVCKINLQSCAMLSQKGLHKEALKYAKVAQGLVIGSIGCLLKAYNKFFKVKTEVKKLGGGKGGKVLSNKNKKKSSEALKVLEHYLATGKILAKKNLQVPEWAKQIAIADIMLIQATSLDHFKEDFSLSEELSLDSLTFKVILLSICHYCIATELNYIKSSNIFLDVTEKSVEAEYQEAISLLTYFTSTSSKILNHVNEGFFKNCIKSILEKEAKQMRTRKNCVTPVPGEGKSLLNNRKISASNEKKRSRRVKNSCIDLDI